MESPITPPTDNFEYKIRLRDIKDKIWRINEEIEYIKNKDYLRMYWNRDKEYTKELELEKDPEKIGNLRFRIEQNLHRAAKSQRKVDTYLWNYDEPKSMDIDKLEAELKRLEEEKRDIEDIIQMEKIKM
jgi:hypothetical protein